MGDTGSLGLGGALAGARRLHEDRAAAAADRRRLRDRGAERDHPGDLVQALRPARLPDGADPPPLRDEGVVARRRSSCASGSSPRSARARVRARTTCASTSTRDGRGAAARWWSARRARASPRPRRCARCAAGRARSSWPTARARAGVAPAGVEAVLGGDDAELLAGVDLLVKSPGVPAEAPLVRGRARGRDPGLERGRARPTGCSRRRNPIVGVTGTNGKTTTTRAGRRDARARRRAERRRRQRRHGAVDAAPAPSRRARRSCASCRASSSRTSRRSARDAASLLNVTPDHLDRHGTLEAYAAAKLRIFERQRAGDAAVLGVDDPWVRGAGRRRAARRRAARARARGADARTTCARRSPPRALRGRRTTARTRACALAAAARARRARDRTRSRRCAGFRRARPPPRARRRDAAACATSNDSKATNVEATLQALDVVPAAACTSILGGSHKGADFAAARRARSRAAPGAPCT